MNIRVISTLELESWTEETCLKVTGTATFARAHATQLFSGDLEGEGQLEVLMTYHPDGSATAVGLEHVVGRVGGREGSFVLEHSGILEDGVSKANILVVPGSGTRELDGLRGSGWCVRPHGQRGALTLEFEIEQ